MKALDFYRVIKNGACTVMRQFFSCIFLLLFILPAHSFAEYKYIDISNPFLRKIPVAVPAFKHTQQDQKTATMAASASTLLSQYLEFTGYFKMSDPGAFLADPQTMEVTAQGIKFENWTAIGAELLVTGVFSIQQGILEMELRLFDTFKRKLLVGKRYKGVVKEKRKMIKRFSSEIIYWLTGERGLFTSRIAFVSTGTGKKEIYACDFDGHNPKQFTHHNSITLFPAWSSDGKWMAYTTYARGRPEIVIKKLKGNTVYRIDKKGLQVSPAWAPGRFELAAALSFSGDQEIYLLTGAGKIIKRLTKSVGIDVAPSWSPDRKKLAFVSRRSGTPQIYTMEVSTGRVQRLTFEGRYNTQPCWSPKGNKIAYSAMQNGNLDIYVINPNGFDEPVKLTEGQGNNESPSFSPDGSLIAFSSKRKGSSKIYIMTAYGTDQRPLFSMSGEQTMPKWSPGNITN